MSLHTGKPAAKKLLLLLFLSSVGCETPDSPAVTTFVSPSVPVNRSTSRTWQTSEIKPVDLISSQFDADANTGTLNLNSGNQQFTYPPALATRGNDDYYMAFSSANFNYATPFTSQSILSAAPSISNNTLLWPSLMGTFFFGSPGGNPFNIFPMLAQTFGGAGAQAFLKSSVFDGSVDYTMHSWVRDQSSDLWNGTSGQSATPSALTAAGFEVNKLSLGLCPPVVAKDYSGGFMAIWCGPDLQPVNSNESSLTANRYTSYNGWQTTPTQPLAANAIVGQALYNNFTYTASVAPPIGAGVDFSFFPDGSTYGWAVQVVSSGRTAGGGTPNNYDLSYMLFNGVTQSFAATTTAILPAPVADVIFSPQIFVEASGSFSAFFARGAAFAATGSIYHAYINYTAPTLPITEGVTSAASISTLDTLAFDSSNQGEYFGVKLAKSPSGTQGILAYPATSNTLSLRHYTGEGLWPLWTTITAPDFTGTIRDWAVSINDNGEAILLVAFQFLPVPNRVLIYGYHYLSSTNAWSSGTLITYPYEVTTVCHSNYIKLSATLDNNTKGLGGITCMPIDITNTTSTIRDFIVPFR